MGKGLHRIYNRTETGLNEGDTPCHRPGGTPSHQNIVPGGKKYFDLSPSKFIK